MAMRYIVIVISLLAVFAQCALAQEASPVGGEKAFATMTIPSPLPLSFTVPTDFSDVTKTIYGEKSHPGLAAYCDPADAQLLRDQLFGNRVQELANKGCLIVSRVPVITYDTNSKRFSVEDDIEAMNRLPTSANRRIEVKNYAVSKREVRGIPILTHIQDSLADRTATRIRFLYATDGVSVWAVTFTSGRQEGISAAIWDAVIKGL
jgi:hypothetical protein